jgi:small ubiquitin-related modifier
MRMHARVTKIKLIPFSIKKSLLVFTFPSPQKTFVIEIMSSTTNTNPTTTSTSVHTDPNAENTITIRVVSQAGHETVFKMKKQTPFKKLMDAFCGKLGAQKSSMKFLFDGMRIQEDQTPEQLKMEDNEQIDVVLEQVGGDLCPQLQTSPSSFRITKKKYIDALWFQTPSDISMSNKGVVFKQSTTSFMACLHS